MTWYAVVEWLAHNWFGLLSWLTILSVAIGTLFYSRKSADTGDKVYSMATRLANMKPDVQVSLAPQAFGIMGGPFSMPASTTLGGNRVYFVRILACNKGDVPAEDYRLSVYVKAPVQFDYSMPFRNDLPRLQAGTVVTADGGERWNEAYMTGHSIPLTDHPIELAQGLLATATTGITQEVQWKLSCRGGYKVDGVQQVTLT